MVDSGEAPVDPPRRTLTLTADATDPAGNELSYRWRATDGVIADVDAPGTTWTLPRGSGLHFAYVLVSNGKGGYTERRVAVSTDDLDTSAVPAPPVDITPPSAPAPETVQFHSFIRSGSYQSGDQSNGVFLPDVPVFLENLTTKTVSDTVFTNVRGRFTFDDLEAGDYVLWCAVDGVSFTRCHASAFYPIAIGHAAANDPYGGPEDGRTEYVGRIVLADGLPCGTVNEFFGVTSTSTAALLDADGNVLAGPYRNNVWGQYALGQDAAAASIRLTCEGADPVTIPADNRTTPRVVIADSAAPVVADLTATAPDGTEVGEMVLPEVGPGSGYALDPEYFLTAKGIDSRLGACRYYQTIGAVEGCDADGTSRGGLTFDDWRRQAAMGPDLRPGFDETTATYVNHVDVNLVRDQHSVKYGPDEVAAYVCNHSGPTDDSQRAIDSAVAEARAGRNLVSCAAMDFRAVPGVNGDRPFTRFLLFGPSGALLPSTNTDGRREKFVPGACVACHGGERYAGRFPTEPGMGFANIGGHFLPYDTGSFSFSSEAGLTKADLQSAIRQLNANVLATRPPDAIQELIAGWYAAGGDELDEHYLPVSWQTRPQVEVDFYHEVYAKSCRTCHVAFKERLNLDHHSNLLRTDAQASDQSALDRMNKSICGGSASWTRSYSMPNSPRILDRFWGTVGTAVDEPALFDAFFASVAGIADVYTPCALSRVPAD